MVATVSRIAVFGPHPLLTVTIEARGPRDDVHLHAGGQGVWLSRMAAELGGEPVLCGFLGGETGTVLDGLLARMPIGLRAVATATPSACLVIDRRSGERQFIAQAVSQPPGRHEVDDLLSVTTATALESAVLAVCNPYPGDALPVGAYTELVSDVRDNGTPVVVDLSSPRLEHALAGSPDLVKLNDWELAEYVVGPVDGERLIAAAQRLRDAGAQRVLVTRGAEPALLLAEDEPLWVIPPRFEHGAREGCGDSMAGAICAAVARGDSWLEAVRLGAAAGAANFLRRGLGTGAQVVVEELVGRVELRAYADGA
jgi:1-phosphofructokinase